MAGHSPEEHLHQCLTFQECIVIGIVDFIRISLLNTLLCLLAIVYGYPSMALRKLFRKCFK